LRADERQADQADSDDDPQDPVDGSDVRFHIDASFKAWSWKNDAADQAGGRHG
jgi:hypothetical protein